MLYGRVTFPSRAYFQNNKYEEAEASESAERKAEKATSLAFKPR